jgi:hypothetical protein
MWLTIMLGLCCGGCARHAEPGRVEDAKLHIPRDMVKCKVRYKFEPRRLSDEGTKRLANLLNEITPENGYRRFQWPDNPRGPAADIILYFVSHADADIETESVQVRVWMFIPGVVGFPGGNSFEIGESKVQEIDEIMKSHSTPE